MRHETLWGSKLITGLKAFALGEFDILGAPRFIRHLDICLLLLLRHLDVNDGLLYVGPDNNPRLSVRHLTVAVLQYQLLTE